MTKHKKARGLLFIASLIVGLLAGCSPRIYLNDRQTVLEEEAAGEWPDFEKDLLDKSKAFGPTQFSKTEMSAKNNRLYNVLNGELTSRNTIQHTTQSTKKKD